VWRQLLEAALNRFTKMPMTGERVTGERMSARARAKNDEAATEAASA
jgi:hypothetical protein